VSLMVVVLKVRHEVAHLIVNRRVDLL
jgi:hypothetical protein